MVQAATGREDPGLFCFPGNGREMARSVTPLMLAQPGG
jgi:hypothetical protein